MREPKVVKLFVAAATRSAFPASLKLLHLLWAGALWPGFLI